MLNVLADMALESEAATTLALRLAAAYDAALAERYRWHEFGDSHLLLRE